MSEYKFCKQYCKSQTSQPAKIHFNFPLGRAAESLNYFFFFIRSFLNILEEFGNFWARLKHIILLWKKGRGFH